MRGVDLGRGVSRALGSNRGLGESLLDRDDVLYAHLYRHFVALAKSTPRTRFFCRHVRAGRP